MPHPVIWRQGRNQIAAGIRNYLIGLGLAAALTIGSFWVASGTSLIYTPGVAMALAALAVAQMGVHLAFFLHITTGPDNTNNALALAFGALIVGNVIRRIAVDYVPPQRQHDGAGYYDGHAHAALNTASGRGHYGEGGHHLRHQKL